LREARHSRSREQEQAKEDAMITTCAKCGEALIAPDWSEFVSEALVVNLWDLHEVRASVRN
jgi:hypothetical protein